MADHAVEKNKKDPVTEAWSEVADTKAGVIALTWLKNRSYFESSTIVGDPNTREVNVYGTLFHEAARRVYLDIRRHIRPELLKRIER